MGTDDPAFGIRASAGIALVAFMDILSVGIYCFAYQKGVPSRH